MTKEFGIIRGHDNRCSGQSSPGLSELVLSLRQEMRHMFRHGLHRLGPIVEQLVGATAGDSMVFKSARVADPGCREKPRHGFPLRLIGQIPVKFPVSRVPRISSLAAPNLSGTERITPENRDSPGATNWQKDRRRRRRRTLQESMSLHNAVADSFGQQVWLQRGRPGALREPEPRGAMTESALVLTKTQTQLSPKAPGFIGQQGQDGMCGWACEHF